MEKNENNIGSITPTDLQNKGIQLAKNWYLNESNIKPVFIINGYAGTGKSTLVRFIIKELNLNTENVVFAAYTGMATSVLLRKGNKNCSTIHKLIYDCLAYDDPETRKKKFKFTLKDHLDESIKLIVIDEFSMVGGKILDDLLSFKVPILALGDPGLDN